jgi:hypothetical protein
LPSDDLLTISDVLGTGWFAADAADVKPGSTVAVVGDGAVGLLGVLSAKQMGAERIIADTYYAPWGNLALFHKDFRYSEGLVRLGRIDSGIEALRRKGPLKVTIEIAGE